MAESDRLRVRSNHVEHEHKSFVLIVFALAREVPRLYLPLCAQGNPQRGGGVRACGVKVAEFFLATGRVYRPNGET